MKKTNILRNKKEVNKIMRVLKNSRLNWLLEADETEVISLNRGELKITFYWEGGEFPTGEEYAPSRSEYICSLKEGKVFFKQKTSMGDNLWIFDKRGRLLWESPSEGHKRRSRPCRK